MPTNNNGNRVHLKHAVVAVCDNQNGTVATSSLQLGKSFMFNAQYEPPGAVLFWLSVSLTKETTLYVRFKPSVILSLKRFACNDPNKRPPLFDTIQGHLDGHRSFTRLEFKLRNYGELVVPIGFDLEDYEDQAHRFESINSLATTLNFSLYMPLDTFRKPDHQFFYSFINPPSDPPEEQNAALLRITNLQDLYQGKGGELFHSISQDGLPPPCYDLLPPPKYKSAEGQSPRASQQSTSDSDIATVAASTPSAFGDDDEGHHASPGAHKESCCKRGLSSDGESVSQVIRRKRQAMHDSSQSRFSFVGLDHHNAFNRIQELEAMVQEQMKEMRQLKKRLQDLEDRVEVVEADKENVDNTMAEVKCTVEYDQDEMKGQLETMSANVHELGQDVEKITAHAEEYIEDLVDSRMEAYVQHKAQEAAAKFEKEFKENLFRSLAETCSLTKSTN